MSEEVIPNPDYLQKMADGENKCVSVTVGLPAEDLIIDDSNFSQYFFDVRTHRPQKGQIMVCYSAMADLVESNEKRQLLDLLLMENKAEAATHVMQRLLFACEEDSIKVPRQMAEDLAKGMKLEAVLGKPYKYKIELFYYTMPEYIPADPHWTSISLVGL